MATLKLDIPRDGGRYMLMETGEQYEQVWRFRDLEEARSHLARLNMDEAKLAEIWAGHEVELEEGQVWPAQDRPAHPAAFEQPRPEHRTGGRR